MLGQPVSMLIPQVVGFRLHGQLPEGATATDLVLTVTEMLRRKGVVGKFVEFYGEGLAALPLADRATIANMAPEYGATCGIFPVDAETLRYLRLHRPARGARRAWSRRTARSRACSTRPARPRPVYSDTLELDLGTVEPSLAGPTRPQDRVPLSQAEEVVRGRPARRCSSKTKPKVAAKDVKRLADEAGSPAAMQVAEPPSRSTCRARSSVMIENAAHELRPRLGGHRRHHQLHEHLEPVGDAGGRPAGEEGRRARPADASRGSRPAWRPARRW